MQLTNLNSSLYLIGTLVALVGLSHCVQGFLNFKAKTQMEKDYDLLNKLLLSKLGDNENPIDHLFAALDWLKIQQGEANPDNIKNLPNKEALLLFTSLLQLMNPKKPVCDITTTKILYQNEQACGIELIKPRKEIGHMRRIEDMVHQIASAHASICREKHPEKLAKTLKRLDNESSYNVQYITLLLNAVIDSNQMPVFTNGGIEPDPRYVRKLKAAAVSWKGMREAEVVLGYLRDTVEVEEERYLRKVPDPEVRNKWIVKDKEVRQILERYVYLNCQNFVDTLLLTIEPALVDERFFEDDNKYRAVNNDYGELLIYIQYYSLCQKLIEESSHDTLGNNIIKIINYEK